MIDSPRLRVLIGTHGMQLAAVLMVAATLAVLSGGWLAFSPPTETVTQQAHQQEVVTSTGTTAVVAAEDSLWPEGTELRDNPVYLYNATPGMTVAAETEARGAEEATISHEWTLTVLAENDDRVFWSETETLAVETHEGTTARTNATVDAAELRERVERRQDVVGDGGTVSAVLALTVEYETDRYDGSTRLSTPIELGGDAYGLGEDLADSAEHSTPVQSEVTRPPNRAVVFGLVGFGLIAFAAAASIVHQRPDAIDVEAARTDAHRHQYAEWISPGSIPDGLSQAFLEVESLEDVVDVAIDTNERVIHDTRRDLFAVVGDDVVYYYSPEGSWEETVFPQFDFTESLDGGDATSVDRDDPDESFGMGIQSPDGGNVPWDGGEEED